MRVPLPLRGAGSPNRRPGPDAKSRVLLERSAGSPVKRSGGLIQGRRVKFTSFASLVCILAGAGLVVCLALERRAAASLADQNDALRRQLTELRSEAAGQQPLPARVGEKELGFGLETGEPAVPVGATEPVRELVRLRAEVQELRHRRSELEVQSAEASPGSREARLVPAAIAGTPRFEIVRADYWTATTNMDVADELRERIRDDTLKAVASNNIKGDPDFGQVKHLTVVYRVDGTTMTNEFREGELVILPRPAGQQP